MTLLRIFLAIFALLLIIALGGGFYAYTRLPVLVEEQAKSYLQDFGVQSLKYRGLALTPSRLSFDELIVDGSLEKIQYRGTISSLQVNFNWRDLSEGKLVSLIAANLQVELEDNSPSPSPSPVEPEPPSSITISSFLPRQYLKQIPLELLEVQHWVINYEKPNAFAQNAEGSFLYNGQLSLDFQTQAADTLLAGQFWTDGSEQYPRAKIAATQSGSDIAKVSAILESPKADSWQWSVNGQIEYAPLISALRSANQHYALKLDLSTLDVLQIQGNSSLDGKIRHEDSIELVSPDNHDLLSQFEIEIESNNDVKDLAIEKIVQGFHAQIPVSATVYQGAYSISIAPVTIDAQLPANASYVPIDLKTWLKWSDTIPVHFSSPEKIVISSTSEGGWLAQLEKTLIKVGEKQSQFQLSDLNTKLKLLPGDELQGSMELNARLVSRLNKSQLPALKLSAQIEGKETASQFKFRIDDIAQSMTATASGNGNLATGKSKVALTIASEDLSYASETLIPLLHSLDLLSSKVHPTISSGRLSLNSLLSSKSFELRDIDLDNELTVERVSGEHDSYAFEQVAVHAKWNGIDQLKTSQAVDISVARLNLGIELLDTRIKLSLPKKTPVSKPAIFVNEFSSKIFGGEIYLPEPKAWDFGAESNSFIVKAKGWQLADMVALQRDEDIHAQGTLEGQLPVELTDGRLIIADGYLRAVAPGGTIRYIANEASEALAASNRELELALDLLSDFQFQVLSSEVELDNKGNLALRLSLQGKNPTQFEGRPINFNINVEQNLDPLLQSLRLSDKLVEKIEGRLK